MLKCFFCFIIIVNLSPSWSYAFDDKQTHPLLTKNAVENTKNLINVLQKQLGLENDIDEPLNNGQHTYSITRWLREGSKEEDEPACRASSHFHNPLLPWAEAQLTDSIWLIDRWCSLTSPYRTKYSNLIWATGYLSKGLRMPSPPNNELYEINGKNGRNWNVARDLFYRSLTYTNSGDREHNLAETFKTLGYIVHLLQDMAVPAHARNDFSQGHTQNIGCPEEGDCFPQGWIGNPFEGYVRDNFEDSIKPLIAENISQPFSGNKILTNFWDTDTVLNGTNDIPQTGFNIGLAEYTNANFVSHATILKEESDTEHYFPYPNRDSIADQDYPDQVDERLYNILSRDGKLDKGVYITKNKHGEIIEKYLKPRYILHSYDLSNWEEVSKRYNLRFTLDNQCYLEYAKKLIPRAVGYSATLLDYFFRGRLEISPPDQYVYSIIDGSEIDLNDNTQYIRQLQAKVKNITPDEEMLSGSLVAIAKYKKLVGYQPDLSSGSPTAEMRETEFSYSISESIAISSLSSTTPEEFLFDFTNDPIPVGITDLYLQVVFRGTLGNEEEIAVAVGMKDLNEPQHITIWNDTDYFLLNGAPVKADDIRDDPFAMFYGHIDPYTFSDHFGFSQNYPDVDMSPIVVMHDLPPARYSRIILVTDSSNDSYYITDHVDAYWQPDEPGTDVAIIDATWKYSLPTAVHQEDGDGVWHSSPVYRGRGVVQHQRIYLINSYPEFIYINSLPAPPENTLGPFPATINLSN